MKFDDVFCNTFKALRKKINPEIKKQVDMMLPSMPMVEACRADDFDFFQPLIEAGDLTVDQMHHAAQRYHLGKSKSGKPIFWMIDDFYQPLDGHIGDAWVSQSLKAREPLLQYWQVSHCLFGQHLLCHTDPTDINSFNLFNSWFRNIQISVVESEVSAVILSELCPESLWMAYVTPSNLTPDLFVPLQDCTVTIYPRTDPSMSNYLFFLDYAELVRRSCPNIRLTVEDILEQSATDDQKSRCIDLLDFITEQ